jgi:hypothetical protein
MKSRTARVKWLFSKIELQHRSLTCFVASLLVTIVVLCAPGNAQSYLGQPATLLGQASSSATRDPQAVVVAQSALAAMGGTLPSDSAATGTVTIVEGSKTSSGAIRILTRGLDQSAEHIQLMNEKRSAIYSRNEANEIAHGATKRASLELAATSHVPDFPLPILAATFANPDMAFQYVGEETLDGSVTHHIRWWNTYGSNQKMREHMSGFTRKDLWLDAITGLPRKLVYERKEAHGAVATVRMEIVYSDWRTVNGVQYPYRIEKSWNGMPWTTIIIQNVAFQTGLSDADFPINAQSEGR